MDQDTIAIKAYRKVADLLIALYGRWLAEREYEDIKDYAIPVRKALKGMPEVTVIKMTARPFGVKYDVGDIHYHIFKQKDQFVMSRKI